MCTSSCTPRHWTLLDIHWTLTGQSSKSIIVIFTSFSQFHWTLTGHSDGVRWGVLHCVHGMCLGCAWAVLVPCLGCAWGVRALCMGCGMRLFVPVMMQSYEKLQKQLVCPRLNDSQQTAAQVRSTQLIYSVLGNNVPQRHLV